MTPQCGRATLAPMARSLKPIETAPQQAEQPELMLCWTQLLRETEPETVGPPRPLGPTSNWTEMAQVFAALDEDPLDEGHSST